MSCLPCHSLTPSLHFSLLEALSVLHLSRCNGDFIWGGSEPGLNRFEKGWVLKPRETHEWNISFNVED